ncbi:ADP-ribosylhydrolase ARH3-like [Cylas formicarius]|uniref:ADP-ribosylhydrolase ARH3-like n=1 Tax=Cylas formicarius TaxID=197179 RepID=UPI0029589B63|nr:ADP-ribosylhydrolase ARH3-like [Cylas formicarius]XP_060531178.1 ADP-ribosylhydrolase ARH3-like [Cylas formicarius]XP_060531179.1 ADP-ribosylhydrolase ARH3-like [Cylas formicarius]
MVDVLLKGKFRGAMLGSLLGDCLGAPFESQEFISKVILQRYLDKLEDPEFKSPFKKYTDDTAMMKSVAKFLVEKPDGDYRYIAKLFVEEFFQSPGRGYGQNVVNVFRKLKNSKYEDIFKPAQKQFGGLGSYGNGGAMRIAPIALFYHSDYENMVRVASESTKITHSNVLGINGAILQCLAIHQSLLIDPTKGSVDSKQFLDNLSEKIKVVEDDFQDDDNEFATAYQEKLQRIMSLLDKEHSDDLDDMVILTLGNGISAYESVPTAIYCFLRAQKMIPNIDTSNIFRRTIQYAISLGGDTDTIACMAGAIAGAYLGQPSINESILKHCERYEEIIEMSDNLFNACVKTNLFIR